MTEEKQEQNILLNLIKERESNKRLVSLSKLEEGQNPLDKTPL